MGRKFLVAAYGAAIGAAIGLALASVVVVRSTPAVASKNSPAIYYIDEDQADAVLRRT